jgi:hypothetical protein
VPPYLLDHGEIAMLGRTFASVFRDVSLWRSASGDLFLLGYKDKAYFDEIALERAIPGAAHAFQVPVPKFLARVQAGAGPMETYDRPRLEFAAAGHLVEKSARGRRNRALGETAETILEVNVRRAYRKS